MRKPARNCERVCGVRTAENFACLVTSSEKKSAGCSSSKKFPNTTLALSGWDNEAKLELIKNI